MKIHWQFLKKPSVIIGAIILFFILLFLMNRGGGSASTGTSTVTTGPSDAQVASSTQLALAQISAGLQGQAISVDYAKSQDANQTQLALATIAAAADTQGLAVQKAIADQTIAAQVHGLDLQYMTNSNNNATQLAALQSGYNFNLATTAINANLTEQLSQDQLKAFETQSLVSGIQYIKHDKDEALQAIIASVTGAGTNYHGINIPPSSGNAGTTSTIVNIPTNMLTVAGGSLA